MPATRAARVSASAQRLASCASRRVTPAATARPTARIPAAARSCASRAAVSPWMVGSAAHEATATAETPAISAPEGAPASAAASATRPSAAAAPSASRCRTPGAPESVLGASVMPDTPGLAATERKRIDPSENPRKRPALASSVPSLKRVNRSSAGASGMAFTIARHPV